ncbi:hypothetical protein [Ruegeria sp. Alg231-54]|uniref:hypothetical protein n=1 Tax=Ruegeria sp. Alg231-54 TaxID=1922221 RepID=UPI000D54FD06|nr:hypothetical protein [Ruegeria sp. Alg231-54]
MTNAKQCAACGEALQDGLPVYSLALPRLHPDFRWRRDLPLQTRQTAPAMHDGHNRLHCCSKACANRALRRGDAGPPISDADTAQMREAAKRQKKAEHQQHRLQHKRDAGKQARLCDWCAKAFEVRRSTAKYCSAACRMAAHRAKSLNCAGQALRPANP